MIVPGSASALLLRSAAPTGYNVERSIRLNAPDSAYLSRTPASAGNQTKFTYAFWIKRTAFGTGSVFSANAGDFDIRLAETLTYDVTPLGGSRLIRSTPNLFRDPSAWYHFVFVVDTANATSESRIRAYVNSVEVVFSTVTLGSGYVPVNSSLPINNTTAHNIGRRVVTNDFLLNGYLADVIFVDGQALDPTSFTEVDATTGQLVPKAYSGSFGTNGFWLKFSDNSAATATTLGKDYSGNNNNFTPNNLSVTGLVDHTPAGLSYRDSSTTSRNWDQSSASSTTSAAIGPDRIYWVDLGASKSFNRITFSVVASGQSSDTSTNFITYFSTSSSSTGSTICGGGCTVTSASRPSATTPGTITVTFAGFASQTGRYIGITNGSGAQGGTYTYSNFKVYDDQGKDNDSLVDTPVSSGADTGLGGQVTGNYCTLNPLNNGGITLSNGNLDWAGNGAGTKVSYGTVAVSSGKWYFEASINGATGGVNWECGIARVGTANNSRPGNTANGWQVGTSSTTTIFKINNNSITNIYTSGLTNGDILSVAFDVDNGRIWFARNGTWLEGSPSAGTGASFTNVSGTVAPFGGSDGSGPSSAMNFGQRQWAYAAPAGFKALCDTNLPAPVVAKPNTVMDVKLWTGNATARSITGFNFSPDFVWIKNRADSVAGDHRLFDTVRGATKELYSNLTGAEATETGGLTAFNSDGFSLGTINAVNGNADGIVGWTWDAGSSTVTNTQGSITSQVRANASAGFSIVTFTGNNTAGATIGHGLNAIAQFIITFKRGGGREHAVWHSGLSSSGTLYLANTYAAATYPNRFDVTGFTSNVFKIGSTTNTVNEVDNYVAYCWAPVTGYSAMGSYSGSGNASGSFVYTGHRPRWVMIKRTDTTGYWYIFDAARNLYNVANRILYANTSDAEGTGTTSEYIDFLSNGFKLRGGPYAGLDASGGTYVYFAVAENPFQYARAR